METNNRTDFTEEQINAVWEKAQIVEGNSPDNFRKDYTGAWIKRSSYGDTNSIFGWEIDHLKPVKKGGTNDMSNLLPLQWNNNRKKDDDYPQWETSKTSEGNTNIDKIQSWYIKING